MTTTNYNHTDTCNLNRSKKPSKIIQQIVFALLKVLILVFILVLSTSYESGNPKIGTHQVEYYVSPMQRIIKSWAYIKMEKDRSRNYKFYLHYLTAEFYEKNDYIPVWTINFEPNENALKVYDLMKNANQFGFYPEHFNVNVLEELEKNMNYYNDVKKKLKIRTDYEIEFTQSVFNFMLHLNKGIESYDTASSYLEFANNLPEYLFTSIHSEKLNENILALQPQNYQYSRLQKALENYIGSSKISKYYIEIPDLKKDSAELTIITKKILMNLGYLINNDTVTNEIFIDAIKTFQISNDLEATGEIDSKTIKILEKSFYYGFMKIALNLDRLRKINSNSNHYVYVNIPSFKLKVIKNNAEAREFKVIVGKPNSPTPELSSKIESIVANPYWNVPYSITMNEIIPKIKTDTNYLERNRMELVDKYGVPVDHRNLDFNSMDFKNYTYKFRQDASRSNALGIIKFSFSNPYNVYLHDTPGKKLFAKDVRAFSHGCIRLHNPEMFAQYLIQNNNNKKNINIQGLLHSGTHENIILSNPLDITIGYITCEADESLNIHYFKDIYNKDNKVMEKLFGVSI